VSGDDTSSRSSEPTGEEQSSETRFGKPRHDLADKVDVSLEPGEARLNVCDLARQPFDVIARDWWLLLGC
jgi:hypothetical protein